MIVANVTESASYDALIAAVGGAVMASAARQTRECRILCRRDAGWMSSTRSTDVTSLQFVDCSRVLATPNRARLSRAWEGHGRTEDLT